MTGRRLRLFAEKQLVQVNDRKEGKHQKLEEKRDFAEQKAESSCAGCRAASGSGTHDSFTLRFQILVSCAAVRSVIPAGILPHILGGPADIVRGDQDDTGLFALQLGDGFFIAFDEKFDAVLRADQGGAFIAF